ncbi:MAG TPA: hypothetical protein PKA63_06965 [Oligoflexia bacterium]|nr:hypothetical protein [Oligoflexia bacterium]HMP48391.1 hypothetical protein [Oligoflexia bacterium]
MAISLPTEKLQAIQVSEYLKRGFELWKSNLGILVLSLLVLIFLSAISIGILAGPLFAGFIKICSRLEKPIPGTPTPKVGDLFEGFDVFLPSLVFMVLLFLISIVLNFILGLFGSFGGIASSIIGMIIGGSAVSIGLPLIAFKKTSSAIEAIGALFNALKEAPVPTSILFFVAGLISYLGVILLGIGIILTAPFSSCVAACLYNDLFRENEEVTVM